jgi:predicted nucleotide-binding protein
MMQEAEAQLKQIAQELDTFVFETIGAKSQYGNLAELKPEWIDWTIRAEGVVKTIFGTSKVYQILSSALAVRLIGNGRANFDRTKMQLQGALMAAVKTVADQPASTGSATAPSTLSNRVFIVHGHDDKSKNELEILLHELGLEPIVLHRQADEGRTIIEKFEAYSDVGYAFILLTPDDWAYSASITDLSVAAKNQELRARPNVIFEFGFFVGKLGRKHVCCLHTGNVTLPSDVQGVIYKSFVKSIEEVAYPIIKELKARGYNLKQ